MSDTAGSRNEGSVDQLLLEAGLEDDGQLRPALLELRALGTGVPEPSASVAALLDRAAGAAAEETQAPAEPPATSGRTPDAPAGQPADELAARRRAKRRAALTALTLGVSLAAGGTVAAASDQGIRNSFGQLHQAVTTFVTGAGSTVRPQAPAAEPADAPKLPAPTAPSSPAAVPTAPAPAAAPADVQASGKPAATHTAGPNSGQADKPAEVPVPGGVPTDLPHDVGDKLGQRPQVPLPETPELSVPSTVPGVTSK